MKWLVLIALVVGCGSRRSYVARTKIPSSPQNKPVLEACEEYRLAVERTAATDVRYTMRYVNVRQQCKDELRPGCRAAVDVLVDASDTITDVHGKPVRPEKRELVLEWDGRRWLFLSGM